jgi:hypothetical protein
MVRFDTIDESLGIDRAKGFKKGAISTIKLVCSYMDLFYPKTGGYSKVPEAQACPVPLRFLHSPCQQALSDGTVKVCLKNLSKPCSVPSMNGI